MKQSIAVRIVCVLPPHRLESVKTAVANLGISGMNVMDVRGTGNSIEQPAWFKGEPHVVALPIRSRLEVVAPIEMQKDIIDTILRIAQTGQAGDGKIFVEEVLDAVRVRTAERGETAI